MARKPSGVTGPVRVTVGPDGAHLEHEKIQWPTDQKEIERKILGYFVREFEKTGATILSVKDGGTEELDFLLELPGGSAHLELMEAVVPADRVPFQPGHGHYVAGPYAAKVFAGVERKIAKYGLRHEVPIDLLICTTHEQYNPNDAALWVLARRFAETPHPFEYVFFLTPSSETDARMVVLFNKDYAIDLPPLEAVENVSWINLVGSEAKLLTQDSSAP
ncbi:hypothetical protein [Ralstonia pseudosolanacearum]